MPSRPDAIAIIEQDVISSSTPLEMQLTGVHPRLHVSAARLVAIRTQLTEPTYAYLAAAVRRQAESLAGKPVLAEGDTGEPIKLATFQAAGVDKRGYGDRISQLAGHYLLSGDPAARDEALAVMRALATYSDWGASLTYGHWAHGMACGIDWLWEEIDPAEREHFIDVLQARTDHVFREWSSYRSGEPFGYTWNIMGVILGGFGAAASVLYGERPNIARYINLFSEKTRASAHALGPDGVSPEGMAYGSYYTRYMTHAFTFVRDLVGVDLFQICDWYRALPTAIRHHLLSRGAWQDGPRCVQLGDSHDDAAGAWGALRACARAYRDGYAQWLAGELETAVPGHESGDVIALFNYAPEVPAVAPVADPTLKHFPDLEIVIGRSDWRGEEAVYAMKCGPAAGHKGVTQYPNPLAGGHMQPSAGVLQVFSHGQWLLAHADYTWKDTTYHNCLIVDGANQEGGDGEWFEDLAYRQGAPSPHILRATACAWGDYVLANPGPAYRASSGVQRYYRHLLYVRPHCWVVIDAIRLQQPATPEVLWHTLTPWSEQRPGVYTATHEGASVRVTALGLGDLACSTEEQTILHSSRYTVAPRQLLRLRPATPASDHIIVTAIETSAAAESPVTAVSCVQSAGQLQITIAGPQPLHLSLDPFADNDPVRLPD